MLVHEIIPIEAIGTILFPIARPWPGERGRRVETRLEACWNSTCSVRHMIRASLLILTCLLIDPGQAFSVSPAVLTSSYGGNIQAAISSLGGQGGTVIVDQDANPSGSIILVSNLTITCLAGIAITQSSLTTDIFAAIGATNFTIRNCKGIGGHSFFSGVNISTWSILNNTITGWGTFGITTGMPANNGTVRGNTISNCTAGCLDAIFIQDPGSNIVVDTNAIDTTGSQNDGAGHGAHGIAVHTYAAGGSATGVQVTSNLINHCGGNFPIELGSFGTASSAPVSPNVSGNTIVACLLNNGGISLSTVTGGSVQNNIINENSTAPLIASIEIVAAPGASLLGNKIVNAGPGGRALVLDSSSSVTAQGNQFLGLVFIGNSGMHGTTSLSQNSFTGNVITTPAGSSWLYGIWMQCNVGSCLAQGNQFRANQFAGLNLPNSYAIYLEADKGVIDSTQIVANVQAGFSGTYGSRGAVTNTDQIP